MESLAIAIIFAPLSFVYRAAVFVHRWCTRTHKLPFPVVSVGNIAMGGRGKTPFVIWLSQKLHTAGFSPVVLTRGYKRSSHQDILWSFGDPVEVSQMGDEASEMALSGCIEAVLVGANRVKNAKNYLYLQKEIKKIVFILDDGFQHWRLHRDIDIVLVEPHDFKNKVFPWGELRESVASLKRANIVLESGKNFFKETHLPTVEGGRELGALTTRANSKPYFLELQKTFKDIKTISLKDHASDKEIFLKLKKQNGSHWILGDKEAVKVFSQNEFLNFKSQQFLKKRIFSKDYTFYRAGLHLHLQNEYEVLQTIKTRLSKHRVSDMTIKGNP